MVHVTKIIFMKMIKLITHPVTIIIGFLLIMISGEHLGGCYLLYILLGLPHGAVHSLLAIVGIGLLLFSNYKYQQQFIFNIEPVLNIIGLILLLLSLFLFFYNDKSHYNYGTFYQTIPVLLLSVLALLVAGFLLHNLSKIKFRQMAS